MRRWNAMWMMTALAWAFLAAACSCYGQVSIKGPSKAPVGPLIVLTAEGDADSYAWAVDTSEVQIPGKTDAVSELSDAIAALRKAGFDVQPPPATAHVVWMTSEDGRTLILSGCPGKYRVVLASTKDNVAAATGPHIVTVGKGVAPTPIPVPDPDDETTPTPVPPQPGGPVRILIVEETKERVRLDPKQLAILTSLDVQNFVAEKAKWYRIWDTDGDASKAPAELRALLEKERSELPWVYITNGVSGYDGPLPGSIEEFKALVNRYAPKKEDD